MSAPIASTKNIKSVKPPPPNDSTFPDYLHHQAKLLQMKTKFLSRLLTSLSPTDDSLKYILKSEMSTQPGTFPVELKTVRGQRALEEYNTAVDCYFAVLKRFKNIHQDKLK